MTMRPRRRAGVSASVAALLVAVLTACSSSGGATTTPAQPAAPSGTAANQRGGGSAGFGPAASGEIAAKKGTTLQVQSSSAQTAVRFTGRTTFTAQKATTRKAVKVGMCVTAVGTANSSSASVSAKTVEVGSCAASRGLGGARPSGANRPSGLPTGMAGGGFPTGVAPSGAPASRLAGGAGAGGFVSGTVTAVHGSSITVKARAFGATGSADTTRSVHVTAATIYRMTAKATSSAAKVGTCAVVQGKTDGKGTVTASRIALSPKTSGACTTGFGTGGPRG